VTSVLLDTHAFLWFIFDDPRLSNAAVNVIEDRSVSKLLSVMSLWEITIKHQIGKLKLGIPLGDFFDQHVTGRDLELLDIEIGHLLEYDSLPLIHRDPFDRLLVAQARVIDVPVVTADQNFSRYEVRVVW
jgi:PIN domain nuclease of toxin-antitoxin system